VYRNWFLQKSDRKTIADRIVQCRFSAGRGLPSQKSNGSQARPEAEMESRKIKADEIGKLLYLLPLVVILHVAILFILARDVVVGIDVIALGSLGHVP
jgi:hypothetical protein